MKHFFYGLVVTLLIPLMGISQERQAKQSKNQVEIITNKKVGPLMLYIINGTYYLGDTVNLLIPHLDASQIQHIEVLKDEKEKIKHHQKVGKLAKNIQDIIVIDTKENFVYKASK